MRGPTHEPKPEYSSRKLTSCTGATSSPPSTSKLFGGLSAAELRLWVRTWLNFVERKLRARPIVYTNVSSWAALGDPTEFADAGHPLWVANFDVDVPLVPADNWGGQGWSIWQFTSSGTVAGVEGRVDRNVLRGGFRALSVR